MNVWFNMKVVRMWMWKITNLERFKINNKSTKKKTLESNYQMYPSQNSIFNVLFHLLICFEHLEHHLVYNKCSKWCWQTWEFWEEHTLLGRTIPKWSIQEGIVCVGWHDTSKTVNLGTGTWLCLNHIGCHFYCWFFLFLFFFLVALS